MNCKWMPLAAMVMSACAAISACKPAENAAVPTSAANAEVSSGVLKFQALNVGREINADGAVSPQTLFSPEDKIIASVQTFEAAKDVPVRVKLIAMSNGQSVSELSRKVTTNGMANTNFEFPKSGRWVLGRYLVETSIDGKLQARQEIDVREDGPPKPQKPSAGQATEATDEKAAKN